MHRVHTCFKMMLFYNKYIKKNVMEKHNAVQTVVLFGFIFFANINTHFTIS